MGFLEHVSELCSGDDIKLGKKKKKKQWQVSIVLIVLLVNLLWF